MHQRWFWLAFFLFFAWDARAQNFSNLTTLSSSEANSFTPQVATFLPNDALVAWQFHDPILDKNLIQASYSQNNGRSWSAPQVISQTSMDGSNPIVMYSLSGNAIVIWQVYNAISGLYDLYRAVSQDRGVTWNTPVQIAQRVSQNSYQLAASPIEDRMVLCFRYQDPMSGLFLIQTTYSQDGGINWSAPQIVCLQLANHNYPKIAISPSGTIFLLWRFYQSVENLYILQVTKSFDGGITWSAPQSLPIEGTFISWNQIAISPKGNPIVIAQVQDQSNNAFMIEEVHSHDQGNNWSRTIFISNLNHNFAPSLAVSPQGNAVVVWEYFDPVTRNGQIQESHSIDEGQSWSIPRLLSTAEEDCRFSEVTISPSGEVTFATWSSSLGVQRALSRDGGNTWTPADTLLIQATLPDLAFFASDEIVAVWETKVEANFVIQSQILTIPQIVGSVSVSSNLFQSDYYVSLNWSTFLPQGTQYLIFQDQSLIGTTTATSFQAHYLNPNQTYLFTVMAQQSEGGPFTIGKKFITISGNS